MVSASCVNLRGWVQTTESRGETETETETETGSMIASRLTFRHKTKYTGIRRQRASRSPGHNVVRDCNPAEHGYGAGSRVPCSQ
jgi:hypothetical protein